MGRLHARCSANEEIEHVSRKFQRRLPAEVSKDRFARGSATFAAVTGIPTEEYLDGFKDSSPDFGRYVIEWVFGDVYSRTDLDLKTRELWVPGSAHGWCGPNAIRSFAPQR